MLKKLSLYEVVQRRGLFGIDIKRFEDAGMPQPVNSIYLETAVVLARRESWVQVPELVPVKLADVGLLGVIADFP